MNVDNIHSAKTPGSEPVNGKIYRTKTDESLVVLGVRPGGVFVEYADGRFRHMSYREWEMLDPDPTYF